MAENVTTSSRTKRIGMRYRFIHEYIDDGFIKAIFVRTRDNYSDWVTKNVNSATYDDHADQFLSKKPEDKEETKKQQLNFDLDLIRRVLRISRQDQKLTTGRIYMLHIMRE